MFSADDFEHIDYVKLLITIESSSKSSILNVCTLIMTLGGSQSDVNMELPPKRVVVVTVPMTSLQQQYYVALQNHTLANMLRNDASPDPKVQRDCIWTCTDLISSLMY
jgi:hypothetical protein